LNKFDQSIAVNDLAGRLGHVTANDETLGANGPFARGGALGVF
jgi:hypothetical protein